MTPEKGFKYDQGKAKVFLVEPDFILGIARVLTYGAAKYSDDNWKKDLEVSRIYSALQRHVLRWRQGEKNDSESHESHLYHAACCLMFLDYYDRQKTNEAILEIERQLEAYNPRADLENKIRTYQEIHDRTADATVRKGLEIELAELSERLSQLNSSKKQE